MVSVKNIKKMEIVGLVMGLILILGFVSAINVDGESIFSPKSELVKYVVKKTALEFLQEHNDFIDFKGQIELSTYSDDQIVPIIAGVPYILLYDAQIGEHQALILLKHNGYNVYFSKKGDYTVEFKLRAKKTKSINNDENSVKNEIQIKPLSYLTLSLKLNASRVDSSSFGVKPLAFISKEKSQGNIAVSIDFIASSEPEPVSISWSSKLSMEEDFEEKSLVYSFVDTRYHFDEGLISGQAHVTQTVMRGSVETFTFSLPANTFIMGIEGDDVLTWSNIGGKLYVTLKESSKNEHNWIIYFEKAIPSEGGSVSLPAIHPINMDSYRGTVVLEADRGYDVNVYDTKGMMRGKCSVLPERVSGSNLCIDAYRFSEDSWKMDVVVREVIEAKLPPTIVSDIKTLVSIGEGAIKENVLIDFSLTNSPIDEVQLRVPPDMGVLDVSGSYVDSWSMYGDKIKVKLSSVLRNDFSIMVYLERNVNDLNIAFFVPLVQVLDVNKTQGEIIVEAKTDIEISEESLSKMIRVTEDDISQNLLSLASFPVLLSYKYISPDSLLELEVRVYDSLPMVGAAINEAEISRVFTNHKVSLTRAVFDLTNTKMQHLRVKLPEGAEVWSTFVNGVPQRVSKDAVTGEILISVSVARQTGSVSIPVEIFYVEEVSSLEIFGFHSINFPSVSIPISNLKYEIFFPKGWEIFSFGSNLRQISGDHAFLMSKRMRKSIDRAVSSIQSGVSAVQVGGTLQTRSLIVNNDKPGLKVDTSDNNLLSMGTLPVKITLPTIGSRYVFKQEIVSPSTELSLRFIYGTAYITYGLLFIALFAAFHYPVKNYRSYLRNEGYNRKDLVFCLLYLCFLWFFVIGLRTFLKYMLVFASISCTLIYFSNWDNKNALAKEGEEDDDTIEESEGGEETVTEQGTSPKKKEKKGRVLRKERE